MNKQAISVTLDPENLLWLRAKAKSSRSRSVSQTLDRIIASARSGRLASPETVRSVVGTVKIAPADPALLKADAFVRRLFRSSLGKRPPKAGRGRTRRIA